MAVEEIHDENIDYLYNAILELQNIDECYKFFTDLCTVSEIKEMSKRLLAAKMLSKNYIYSTIAEETNLSTATISRVNRCLKYGNNGYRIAIERLNRKRK